MPGTINVHKQLRKGNNYREITGKFGVENATVIDNNLFRLVPVLGHGAQVLPQELVPVFGGAQVLPLELVPVPGHGAQVLPLELVPVFGHGGQVLPLELVRVPGQGAKLVPVHQQMACPGTKSEQGL